MANLRGHRKTLGPAAAGLLFLGLLLVVAPWIVEEIFFHTDKVIYRTKYIWLGYAGFLMVFVSICIPLLRWLLGTRKSTETHPIDTLSTVLIMTASAIPLAILWAVLLPLLRMPGLKKYVFHIYNFLISATLFLIGALVRFKGAIPKKSGRQRIYVANHTSPLDYALISQAMGTDPWNIVAGINLKRGKPKTFWDRCIAWTIGTVVEEHSISVDRNDEKSRQNALRRIIQELDSGINIAIFAEGTRTPMQKIIKNHALLAEFWEPIFKLSWEKSIPIQPIVFDWPVIWRGKNDTRFGFSPCKITTHFLPLIDPKYFDSWEEMKNYCWAVMHEKLRESKRVKKFLLQT